MDKEQRSRRDLGRFACDCVNRTQQRYSLTRPARARWDLAVSGNQEGKIKDRISDQMVRETGVIGRSRVERPCLEDDFFKRPRGNTKLQRYNWRLQFWRGRNFCVSGL